jgi:lipoate---protein ligase
VTHDEVGATHDPDGRTVWQVERYRSNAGSLHGMPVPEPVRRAIWVLEIERPALVLGSTQDGRLVDARLAATLGVEVARRRSGGGAVLLVPGEVAWLDVIVPSGDPLWHDDVSRSGNWLGRSWQATLADLGITGTTVHTGPLDRGGLGRLVCFAAVGPGEVTLGARKIVGVSQRRTRRAARFQCAVYRRWAPDLLVPLLRLDDPSAQALQRVAGGVGASPTEVVTSFLQHLPA